MKKFTFLLLFVLVNTAFLAGAQTVSGGKCLKSCTGDARVGAKVTWTIDNNAGTVTIRTTLAKTFVDNTYGANCIGWPGGAGDGNHTFNHLVTSDALQIALFNKSNTKVLEFRMDYISENPAAPSGYSNLGVTGHEGAIYFGSESNIVKIRTSIDENFNTYGYKLTTSSPATNASYSPNPTYPNWIYDVWYEATIKLSAFGTAGFGNVNIPYLHASPSKTGKDSECLVEDTDCPTTNINNVLSVGNLVWYDANGNGKKEADESGIGGVTVRLYRDDNNDNVADNNTVLSTTTTAANGSYKFSGLSSGRYIVGLVIPAGYIVPQVRANYPDDNIDNDNNAINIVNNGTEVRTNAITLTPAQEPTYDGDDNNSNSTLDLALCGQSRIGDFVWYDGNGNGIQDSNEQGIPNVKVTLTFPDGTTLSKTTDANGFYTFINLGPGSYKVTFETPSGYSPSPANSGTDDAKDSDPVNGSVNVTVVANKEDLTIDAGFCKPLANLTLGNQVWNDKDGDGKRDANEPSIAGATISLYRDNDGDNLPDGAAIKTTMSDETGKYFFKELTPGRYIVSMPILPGFQKSPNTSTQATSPFPDNDIDDDNNLVRLDGPNAVGGVLYTNAITLSANQEPTTDGDDANGNLTMDLAECGNAAIGDFVWNDLNGNGIQDAGETGINGVIVRITFSDGRFDEEETHNYNGKDGYYDFINLGPGTYVITFKTPSGFNPSPANRGTDDTKDSDPVNGSVTVKLVADQSDFTIDAGFTKPCSPCVVKNDCPLTTNTTGYYGGFESSNNFPSGTGSDLYNGLPREGSYQVVRSVDELGGGGYLDIHPHTGSYFLASHTSNNENDRVWYTKVNAVAGQTINFCAAVTLLKNLGDGAVYVLGIYANGQQIGTGRVTFDWTQICGSYVVPEGVTSVELSIRDPKKGLFFVAIDDICISKTNALRLGNQVWNDFDGDGKRDSNEPPIAGATISLYTDNNNDNLPDGAAIKTTVSDANGKYLFTGLAEGRYIASMPILPGFQQSPNTSTPATSPFPDNNVDDDNNLVRLVGPNAPGGILYTNAITLTEGQEPTTDGDDADGNLTFDLAECGNFWIGDFVWNDVNGDGIQDANEEGIDGVDVTITYSDGNSFTKQTETYLDRKGYYDFPRLGPGTYTITFKTPEGFMPSPSNKGANDSLDSDPVNGSAQVTIVNASNMTIDAGFTKAGPPPPPSGDCPGTTDANGYYGGFELGSNSISPKTGGSDLYKGLPREGSYQIVKSVSELGGGGYLDIKAKTGDYFFASHTSNTASDRIWYTNTSVTPGQTYKFCASVTLLKNLGDGAKFIVGVYANGEQIGEGRVTFDWTQICGTYTVPAGVTSVEFSLRDPKKGLFFLATDDICISPEETVAPIVSNKTSANTAELEDTIEELKKECKLKVALEPKNPLCYNNRTGSIVATVTGSTGKVSYAWSNGSTGSNLMNVGAGTYTLKVKDQEGCEVASEVITLTNPEKLETSIKSPLAKGYNIACKDDKSGSIDLTVKGGYGVYTYQWSNGATTQDISAVGAGKYKVVIKDAAGCPAEAAITITEPEQKLELSGAVENINCNHSTGSIKLNAAGGVAPYTYKWSNGSTTKNVENLAAGSYSVTVNDAAGCEVTERFEVKKDEVTVTATADKRIVIAGSGEATTLNAIAKGGTEVYTYSWKASETLKETNKSSVSATPTATTAYEVTVKDGAGCTATASVTVNVVDRAVAASNEKPSVSIAVESIRVTPNPSKGDFSVIINGFETGKVQVKVLDISGKEVAVKTANVSGFQTAIPFSLKVSRGVYVVNVIAADKTFKEKIIIQ